MVLIFVVIVGFFWRVYSDKQDAFETGIMKGAGASALLESESSYEVRVFVESLQEGGKTFIAKKIGKDEKEKYYFADNECSKNIPTDLSFPIILTTFSKDNSDKIECLWTIYKKPVLEYPLTETEKPDE